MLESLKDLVSDLSFLSWLPSLPDGTMGEKAVAISAICSSAGAMILAKFSSSASFFALPMNYAALFAGAVGANYLFAGVELPFDREFQTPILYAVAGMMVAGLSLMMFMQEE